MGADPPPRHHHEGEPHDHSVHDPLAHESAGPDELLARAERICAESGRQLTPLRRRVFDALVRAGAPLGAYDLVERLGRERRISPISVYRALDFLIEAGLIHRIAVRNTYMPCHHVHGAGETTVFLVCTLCGGVDEVASQQVAKELDGTAASADFTPRSRAIELEGECSACRQAS